MDARTSAEYPATARAAFPAWVRIPYAAFVAVLVPVYWAHYGPSNFLWFSDIALFGVGIALWTESRIVGSMMALAVLLPEIAWTIDFLVGLVGGTAVLGLAEYMFDERWPLWLRALSGFHLALPPLLLWILARLGYDPRALPLQTLLAWLVLPASALFAHAPDQNINWTLGFGFLGELPQTWMPHWAWVGVLMAGFPAFLYLPTHLLLGWIFVRRR